jgi:glycosyltransferase involved in cell wall biosynthesis
MHVSVIIPTYNRAATIAEAVESALYQTHREIEVIVVDDGSTDSTLEILRGFGDRIQVVCQENAGPSAARNRGVSASTGEIIAFLDSDDIWLPDKIRQQVELMEQGGERMVCCVCNAESKDLDGRPEGTSFELAGFRPGIPRGEWLNPGEVLATGFLLFNQVVAIRRAAFDNVGGFKRSLRLLEDYDLAIRLSSQGSWGFICDPLVVKRNETVGIGVECQMNHVLHVEKSYIAVREILDEDRMMSPVTRRLLTGARKELYCRLIAERWIAETHGLRRWLGYAVVSFFRILRSLLRRSPWWPRPDVRPLSRQRDSCGCLSGDCKNVPI